MVGTRPKRPVVLGRVGCCFPPRNCQVLGACSCRRSPCVGLRLAVGLFARTTVAGSGFGVRGYEAGEGRAVREGARGVCHAPAKAGGDDAKGSSRLLRGHRPGPGALLGRLPCCIARGGGHRSRRLPGQLLYAHPGTRQKPGLRGPGRSRVLRGEASPREGAEPQPPPPEGPEILSSPWKSHPGVPSSESTARPAPAPPALPRRAPRGMLRDAAEPRGCSGMLLRPGDAPGCCRAPGMLWDAADPQGCSRMLLRPGDALGCFGMLLHPGNAPGCCCVPGMLWDAPGCCCTRGMLRDAPGCCHSWGPPPPLAGPSADATTLPVALVFCLPIACPFLGPDSLSNLGC